MSVIRNEILFLYCIVTSAVLVLRLCWCQAVVNEGTHFGSGLLAQRDIAANPTHNGTSSDSALNPILCNNMKYVIFVERSLYLLGLGSGF